MLDKAYDPESVEKRIYAQWEAEGAFRAGAGARPGKDSFCIVIPPPNVTGSLHMGHALNNTLQDILVRYKRMLGMTCSGSRAPITPASPRRWWSSASLPRSRSVAAT